MTNTFIIGSSNARRVFGENYAGNFLKIGNPEKALSSHGEKEIRNFLKNITINSVIVIHFLINGLYPQREFCDEAKPVNASFKARSEVLKNAVNKVEIIVRQILIGAKLRYRLLVAPFLPRYWYPHCSRRFCKSTVYKVHYLEKLEKSLKELAGSFKWLSIKSLYNFLCRNPVFRIKILNNWNKRLDNSALKSNVCKSLILSELLDKDQVHLKKEYWTLYERYLMEEM